MFYSIFWKQGPPLQVQYRYNFIDNALYDLYAVKSYKYIPKCGHKRKEEGGGIYNML